MKQKIVVRVQMKGEKCSSVASFFLSCMKEQMDGRAKAMKHAAVVAGVISVGIEGKDKDQLVVIGEEVDSVNLTKLLRKKVGHATIVSVEEVKPKDEKKDEKKDPPAIQYIQYPLHPPCEVYESTPGCSIM